MSFLHEGWVTTLIERDAIWLEALVFWEDVFAKVDRSLCMVLPAGLPEHR